MLVAMMLLSCGVAHADDTNLIVQTKTGESKFALNTIKCIKLEDAGISVNINGGENVAFNYSDIDKLYFQMLVSMIESNNNVASFNVSIEGDGSTLFINGVDKVSNVNIYSMNGCIVKKMTNFSGTSIDISGLASGIYIIQVNNQALKFKK